MNAPAIVWFRRDLRLSDNPALTHAADFSIIPLFIWDENDPHTPGGASQWWLYNSLISLQKSLKEKGLNLILRRGNPLKIIQEIVASHNVSTVFWNRCYEPYIITRDQEIKETLSRSIKCHSFNASLLAEPWTLKTRSDSPYQVFNPFFKALQALESFSPLLPIPPLKGYKGSILSDCLEDWGIYPQPDWSQGLSQEWAPGEEGAHKNLTSFLSQALPGYSVYRNFPDERSTSKLSPYLHWGEISPRQVWHSVLNTCLGEPSQNEWSFLKEIAWREFAYYLLYHFPELPTKSLRRQFDQFPWIKDKEYLQKWQKGMTGYPIVDAGMRELWKTGWMHNRVRMITASFLVKHLLISWQEGAAWFYDTLVDADIANNALNWQWVAGCGVDSAPYFRIFNPVLQGQKFDPQGKYVRKWVPEIQLLPDQYIHNPWEAPTGALKSAGVELGKSHPFPIVDHKKARARALEAFATAQSF
ncbi:MAG: DNA photolyase family protein [Alphaproteobacteria bacterium]|nr:DNA photolyase family protein [Alphaproteobacteria bacterium]